MANGQAHPSPFALILAGGSGTRFWPVSRNARPKQLLDLFDDDTLLEKTIARLDGFVPRENILILTNVDQEAGVRDLLADELPAENIIAEPAKRDTAPAIALAVGWVKRRDPNGVMIVLPADHLIQDVGNYQSVMRQAAAAAKATPALVTVGIKPTWACPSYGYIERSGPADIPGLDAELPVYGVERFREKPKPEVAQEYLDRGGFSWNAGMFIWSVTTVLDELKVHVPELAAFIETVSQTEPDQLAALLDDQFAALPKISIDFALMEKAGCVLNIEATFDWDDVGSWISVAGYLEKDRDNNCSNAVLTSKDAQNNIVYSKEGAHVALLGVDDLIVVQTNDALLITTREKADAIKHLVDEVPTELH